MQIKSSSRGFTLQVAKRSIAKLTVWAPAWKREGYAEYVAGGSTLDHDTGVRLWKAKPNDGTGYQYFKYYMMVKYVLETEKLTVDELFTRDIDAAQLEQKVFSTL